MHNTVLLTCSKGYLYGLNAILNGLDYYDNNITDVKVIWYKEKSNVFKDIVDDFFNKIKKVDFKFKVDFIPLEEVMGGKDGSQNKPAWQLRFSKWLYASELDSDCLCVLGGDIMVMDKLDNWMKMAHSSGLIICGHNCLGNYGFHSEKIIHTNNAPYADVPVFIDPKKWSNVLRSVYDIGCTHNLGDMPAWYFSIKPHLNDVVALPDNLWIRNDYGADSIRQGIINGKKVLCAYPPRMRISTIHGKYWSKKVVNKKIITSAPMPYGDRVKNNLTACYAMMKFFNTECKLKLRWKGEEL